MQSDGILKETRQSYGKKLIFHSIFRCLFRVVTSLGETVIKLNQYNYEIQSKIYCKMKGMAIGVTLVKVGGRNLRGKPANRLHHSCLSFPIDLH